VKRGSIHWADQEKRRPVLIVSPDHRNEFAHDMLIVPLSASAHEMGWHVRLNRGEAGLPRACLVLCEQVGLMPKEFVDLEELGVLSAARMREVELALMSALGIQD
jgi:mRNA-degrading endonuclease toxin of MazEF toxin-antitoxin module